MKPQRTQRGAEVFSAILCALCGLMLLSGCQSTESRDVFHDDFESTAIGELPSGTLILDGDFAVAADGANRAIVLPGNPVRRFGMLFGPVMIERGQVSARIRSERRGRRYPQFGVGLMGIRGVRLQVAPAKKAIELLLNNQVIASTEFNWEAGKWTNVNLKIDRGRAIGEVSVDGAQSTIVEAKITSLPPNGRASIWGSPYSGEPIWFDDLLVRN